MELVKKNIHMDRLKSKASTQITLEDDINISDSRPDAFQLILDRGNVGIDELKVTTDHVTVKGKLQFTVAYMTEGENADIASMEGSIPFSEQIYMDGLESGDNVQVKWELEDLSIGLINSRKISVQSIISLFLTCEVISDEETAIDLYHDEPVEYRKKKLDIASMAIKKKDIFRIKEEVEVPGSYPNIQEMVWEDVCPLEVEFKVLEDKISVQGEVKAFFMYRSDGEDNEICHHETTMPFSGVIECNGCEEGMIPEITWKVCQKEVEIRPDFDGEDRVVTFDLVMDLDICIYKEDTVDLLSDIYGVVKDITATTKDATFRRLQSRLNGKTKINEHKTVPARSKPIRKVLHCNGQLQLSSQEIVEEGIMIQGTANLQVLYESTDEKVPYGVVRAIFPFSYTLNAEEITGNCIFRLQADLEQLSVTPIEPRELDVKAILCFRGNVYEQLNEKTIEQINVSEPDIDKMSDLPGIAVYIVKPGESLWDIGKRYYIPVAQLKEANDMQTEEVKPGDKVLIVKNQI
ncbi:MAG: DUF3794 domain-containing protein [Lachnospiraceae bacterium]|nr:DUF3794 domain-containing protein [Lachnospiraceae bacterium]